MNDIRKEIQDLRQKLQNPRALKKLNKDDDGNRVSKRELRQELKQNRREVAQRERAIVSRIIQQAKVIFTTCIGAASYLLKNNNNNNNNNDYDSSRFDLVIVDEAAQSLEAAIWIPILQSTKCILAGDHCQLPPTIKSKVAARGGLNLTLFEKIIKDERFESVVSLLNIQYRMNDRISSWASKNMYQSLLLSDESVAEHTLLDLLPNDQTTTTTTAATASTSLTIEDLPVLLLVDTSDLYMYEDVTICENTTTTSSAVNASHRNLNEAEIVLQHAVYLVRHGIPAEAIGIITPYNGQLELLREIFHTVITSDLQYSSGNSSSHLPAFRGRMLEGIEIKTIDGFQGGEKECIIISLVRSNESHTVGFLAESRRLNVAITRAKRQCVVVCDTSTCSTDQFIKTFIEHAEEVGEVIPADLYLDQYRSITVPTSRQGNSKKDTEQDEEKESEKKATTSSKGSKKNSSSTKKKGK